VTAEGSRTGSITVAGATAIGVGVGVGGMMGAGLYTLVGLASTTAGVWVPLAFLVGGALSLGYTIHTGPASTWITLLAVLALSFAFEVAYRKRTGRSLALESTAA
jgi:hypothetical protein